MFELIKKFFLFLLPIVRRAAVQAAADELNRAAYPTRRPTRRRSGSGYSAYNRVPYNKIQPRERTEFNDYVEKDIQETMDLFGEKGSPEVDIDFNEHRFLREVTPMDRFHDVLVVAFDIRGRDAEYVKDALKNLMPKADGFSDEDADFEIDSWWIADDDMGTSDCDSAVFVARGNQYAARHLLRDRGLSR